MAEYKYKYPNESFSGCDMTASIVYNWVEEDSKGKLKKRYSSHVLGELQTISYSIHMEKRPVRSIGNVNAKDYVMGPRTIAGSLVFAVFNRHFAKNIMAEHNNYFSEGQAFLVDELPPFDVVISLANEYGLRSKLVIYGVRLLNEGQVMSVNDVYTENTYQFMATDVEYMNTELTYQSRSNNSSFFKLIDESKKTKTATAKFDETVEAHIRLGVDSRHADQQVRGAIVLPHGTGKTVRVLVFAKGAKVDEALAAGADYAGGEELIPKIPNDG